MRPRLLHGRPLKPPKPTRPQILHPCHCASCARDIYIDPRTRESINGKLLSSKQEWDMHNPSHIDQGHRDDGEALWNVLALDTAEEGVEHSDLDSQIGGAHDEHSPPSRAASPSRPEPHRRRGPSPSADPELASLRLLLEKVQGWPETLDDLSHTPFFFVGGAVEPSSSPGPVPSLDPNRDAPVLHYIASLEEYRTAAELASRPSSPRSHRAAATLIGRAVASAFSKLEEIKRAKWVMAHEAYLVDTARYRSSWSSYTWNPIPFLCIITVSTLNAFGSLSIDRAAFLLSQLRLLVFVMANAFQVPTERRDVLTEGIPSDVRTAMGRLDVDPVTKPFICCPRCYSLYDVPVNSSEGLKCTHVPVLGGEPCGRTLLRRTAHGPWVPTRRYVYHDFKQWLGRMYARPGIEKYLDRSLKDMCSDTPGEMKDMWDGTVLQEFKGPDGTRHFLDADGEARLVFGLNQDGMNPFGNNQGGAKVSVGPIYMVCFNLPPELRYRTENIFLTGIIPGPKEASGDQMNHLLRPLVDDLLASWTSGYYLSRTAAFPQGRRVRCALVPIIADLPAARALSGLGSARSTHWCSECDQRLPERDNLEQWSWFIRSGELHRERANAWRDAPDQKTRDDLWTEHHIWYSEFLRLPYWDATKYVTIDSMHGFYLGLFQRHIRKIWGMDVSVEDGPDLSSQRGSYTATDAETAIVYERLRNRGDHANLDEAVLMSMCRDVGLRYAGSKGKLYRRLVEYYREHEIPSTTPAPGLSTVPDAEPGVTKEHLAFHTETMTKIKTYGADFLTEMCSQFLGGPEEEYRLLGIPRMLKALQQERKARGIVNDAGRLVISPTGRYQGKKAPRTVYLGATIMAEVSKDMERRKMPNFIGRAPTKAGHASGRKFTADQWKSFCLLHLPYTLTRLWGPYRHSSKPDERAKYDALENFLHLVTAVKLAVAKIQTAASIEKHEEEYRSYARGLLQLYPGTQIESYQHLILHFGDFLRRWGPTQSWRCFAFERYNGILQNIPTNRKFGEMEETMFMSFCRRQNMAALYSPQTLPEELTVARQAFTRYLHYDARGTWAEDVNGDVSHYGFHIIGDMEALSAHAREGLAQWMKSRHQLELPTGTVRGQYADRVTTGRKLFVARHRGGGSSKHADPHQYVVSHDRRVGVIREIFLYTWMNGAQVYKDVFFLVHCFKELSAADAVHDNYCVFPIASGRLVYNRASPEVYSLAEVEHCTVTPLKQAAIGEQVNHVLPIVYDELTGPDGDDDEMAEDI